MKSALIAALSPDLPILVDDEAYKIEPMVFAFSDVMSFDAEVESIHLWGEELCSHGNESFACYDASCRPPTSGGTGGSRKKGAPAAPKAPKPKKEAPQAGGESRGPTANGAKGSSDQDLDLLFPGRRDAKNKVQYKDGTFSVEGLNEDGSFRSWKPKTEEKLAETWRKLGPDEDQYVQNFVIAGKLAMGIDPATNKVVDEATAAEGRAAAKWYSVAHEDCKKIVEDTGIPLDNVVAATTTLSAGRLWSGTKNGNIESARALADIVTNPRDLDVQQQHLDLMAWRAQKSTKGVGKVGLTANLTPGKINTQDLDSGTLAELMYAINTMRGHPSFDDWAAKTTKDGKPGMKSSREQAKTEGLFPYFTSKGTQQVKQAIAILRQEVTPREGISGPKYSSFFSNIRNPDKDYSSTNDTWHYRIMAGNLPITYTSNGSTRTRTIVEHSLKKFSPDGRISTTQDIFQKGGSSASEGMNDGDGMFRDTTRMTRTALDRLRVDSPELFGNMKAHEFQALIWVHYGGGRTSDDDRTDRWFGALDKMAELGL